MSRFGSNPIGLAAVEYHMIDYEDLVDKYNQIKIEYDVAFARYRSKHQELTHRCSQFFN